MSTFVTDCLFCRIVAGEIPATTVFSDDHVIAFRDVAPQAPTHLLVIPRDHYDDIVDLSTASPDLAGALMAAAARIAVDEGLTNGFRIVLNTGPDGGQTVHHVHAHVLGGRPMAWPPG